MPTYSAWYSTGEYGKLWFEADSLEQAQEFLDDVQMGNIDFSALPKLETKIKGEELEIDGLEELP